MRFAHRPRPRAPSVIIVSLIDVLLVVLIFLMVTTAFKQEQSALKLALPDSKTAQPGARDAKPKFIVTVSTNAPFFYLEDKPVTFDRLLKELSERARADPQLKVAIRADKKSPVGEAIRVIDAAKLAHVGSIDIFTEKPAGQ